MVIDVIDNGKLGFDLLKSCRIMSAGSDRVKREAYIIYKVQIY